MREAKTYPIGVNVSKPFAADHGNPCFFTLSWRFLAVMSTAKAWMVNQLNGRAYIGLVNTYCIQPHESQHWLGQYPFLSCL